MLITAATIDDVAAAISIIATIMEIRPAVLLIPMMLITN